MSLRPPSGKPGGFSSSHVPVAMEAHAPPIIQACFRHVIQAITHGRQGHAAPASYSAHCCSTVGGPDYGDSRHVQVYTWIQA